MRLLAQGAHVILLSEQAEALDRVRDSLCSAGMKATCAVADLTQPTQLAGLWERLEAEGGPIDTLVNNAGVGLGATILETRLEDIRFVFEVNFFGLHQMCQQALRCMAPRGFGYILNVTSAAGRFGSPTVSAYSASKGAVHAYTQALRIEASAYNVRVSEILPISVRTQFFESVKGETYQPGGVVLTPAQVAASITRAARQKYPPAEVLPYRPVRLVFAIDSLLPGALGKFAGRSYLRATANALLKRQSEES